MRSLKEALEVVRAQADEQQRASKEEAERLQKECEGLRAAALEQKHIEAMKSCTTDLTALREEVRLLKEVVRAQADEQQRASKEEAERFQKEREGLRAALEQKDIEASKSCATGSTNEHGDDATTVPADYLGASDSQVHGRASESCYASIPGVGEFYNMTLMVTKDGSSGDLRLEIAKAIDIEMALV